MRDQGCSSVAELSPAVWTDGPPFDLQYKQNPKQNLKGIRARPCVLLTEVSIQPSASHTHGAPAVSGVAPSSGSDHSTLDSTTKLHPRGAEKGRLTDTSQVVSVPESPFKMCVDVV